jgi:hypothetical protein
VDTGTEKGLCGISFAGALSSLWTRGVVRKLIKSDGCWIIQNDQGVLVSEDLVYWEIRNGGFPLRAKRKSTFYLLRVKLSHYPGNHLGFYPAPYCCPVSVSRMRVCLAVFCR